MAYICFPENFIIIPAIQARTGAGAEIAGTAISLKYVQKLWVVCNVNTVGTSAQVALVPQTDTAIAFSSAAVFTTALPIWVNTDITTGAQDLVKATSAVNYTTAADALFKQVIFEVDPAICGLTDDCFRIDVTTLAATDFISADYIILPRYAGAVAKQPSVITD